MSIYQVRGKQQTTCMYRGIGGQDSGAMEVVSRELYRSDLIWKGFRAIVF